jgi:pimeloyl-ACP methyl ester carboxylesterase
VTLLPDAAPLMEFLDEVYETYRRSGVDTAMRQFGEGIGMGDGAGPSEGVELPPQLVELMARINANQPFFLEYELRVYPRIQPDLAALKEVSDRLVLAGGRDSREHFPYRPNTVLAERLGREVVDFPGGHIGYVTHPAEFAAQLREVLA